MLEVLGSYRLWKFGMKSLQIDSFVVVLYFPIVKNSKILR